MPQANVKVAASLEEAVELSPASPHAIPSSKQRIRVAVQGAATKAYGVSYIQVSQGTKRAPTFLVVEVKT
jgi:hypothetical protein